MSRALLPGLETDHRSCVYFYAVLPNLLLSPHPDYVMVHTLWPRVQAELRSSASGCFTQTSWLGPGLIFWTTFEFWDLTNRQDWHVCEQMQLGLQSRAYRPGPYSHREDLLHGFDRLILEAGSGPTGRSEKKPLPASIAGALAIR